MKILRMIRPFPLIIAKNYLPFHSESGHYTLNLIGVAGNDDIHTQAGETVTVYSITTSTSLNKICTATGTGNLNVLITHLPDQETMVLIDSLHSVYPHYP